MLDDVSTQSDDNLHEEDEEILRFALIMAHGDTLVARNPDESTLDYVSRRFARHAYDAYRTSPTFSASVNRMRITVPEWDDLHPQSRTAWTDAVRMVLELSGVTWW